MDSDSDSGMQMDPLALDRESSVEVNVVAGCHTECTTKVQNSLTFKNRVKITLLCPSLGTAFVLARDCV